MIIITDTRGKKHYLHVDAISQVTEAGANTAGIWSYIRLFDGGRIESIDSASDIRDQIAASKE